MVRLVVCAGDFGGHIAICSFGIHRRFAREGNTSPPVRFNTSIARAISSVLSQCTERRIPPFCRRPSYCLASYSGIPTPINAPANPPTHPPMPIPASPATIGPAATNGPKPGIARRPTPASNPKVPPITPPVVTPATAPSAGALRGTVVGTTTLAVWMRCVCAVLNAQTTQFNV